MKSSNNSIVPIVRPGRPANGTYCTFAKAIRHDERTISRTAANQKNADMEITCISWGVREYRSPSQLGSQNGVPAGLVLAGSVISIVLVREILDATGEIEMLVDFPSTVQ